MKNPIHRKEKLFVYDKNKLDKIQFDIVTEFKSNSNIINDKLSINKNIVDFSKIKYFIDDITCKNIDNKYKQYLYECMFSHYEYLNKNYKNINIDEYINIFVIN